MDELTPGTRAARDRLAAFLSHPGLRRDVGLGGACTCALRGVKGCSCLTTETKESPDAA